MDAHPVARETLNATIPSKPTKPTKVIAGCRSFEPVLFVFINRPIFKFPLERLPLYLDFFKKDETFTRYLLYALT